MFKWKKLGQIFNPLEHPGKSWMKEFAQAPSIIVFDSFVRVYFSTRPEADSKGQYVSYSGFVDLDRRNLRTVLKVSEAPILELGAIGEFDEFGTYPVSVIKEGEEYWAYYGGWTRCESVPFNVAIGFAKSDNGGMTFKKHGTGPVHSYSPDEPFVLSGPKIRKYKERFYLFYIAGRKWIMTEDRAEPVYKIRVATSIDGIKWERYNKDLIESRLEEDEAQASPDVFFKNGKYHMFFCYRFGLGFRGKDRGYRIGYASSENLLDWKRNDSMAGIDVSKDGWDSEMISYPHVFELDGQVYMLYLGNQVGRQVFGLAQLEGEL